MLFNPSGRTIQIIYKENIHFSYQQLAWKKEENLEHYAEILGNRHLGP
jgi:hypothetical protein